MADRDVIHPSPLSRPQHLCRQYMTPAAAAARWKAARTSASPWRSRHLTTTSNLSLRNAPRRKHRASSQPMQTLKFFSGIPSLLTLLVLVATTTTWATKHAGEQNMPAERRLEVTLADARPLKIHFTLKRSSMKMYDQTEFDVFANPVVSSDNSAVRYDGYANFSEGGDTKHTILIVDGIAYLITSIDGGSEAAECLDSTSLTPLNYILRALNDATSISSATIGGKEISCTSGDLFKVTLADATFVLCASRSDGFIVYGTDLDITVKYLDSRVPITAPKLSDDEARSCETVVTPSRVTTTTLALLTGESIVNTRSLAHYLGHYFTYER